MIKKHMPAPRENGKRLVQQVIFAHPAESSSSGAAPAVSPAPAVPSAPASPPFIPESWASSKHPSERPPSPAPERRPRMSSSVVDSVFSKCRRIDPNCELASATFTHDGETLVRVRTSLSCSVTSLKLAIENTMPLCGTEIVDNPLDGTTEIGVIVAPAGREVLAAKTLSRRRPITRAIGHVGFLLFVAGGASWIVSLVEALAKGDNREL